MSQSPSRQKIKQPPKAPNVPSPCLRRQASIINPIGGGWKGNPRAPIRVNQARLTVANAEMWGHIYKTWLQLLKRRRLFFAHTMPTRTMKLFSPQTSRTPAAVWHPWMNTEILWLRHPGHWTKTFELSFLKLWCSSITHCSGVLWQNQEQLLYTTFFIETGSLMKEIDAVGIAPCQPGSCWKIGPLQNPCHSSLYVTPTIAYGQHTLTKYCRGRFNPMVTTSKNILVKKDLSVQLAIWLSLNLSSMLSSIQPRMPIGALYLLHAALTRSNTITFWGWKRMTCCRSWKTFSHKRALTFQVGYQRKHWINIQIIPLPLKTFTAKRQQRMVFQWTNWLRRLDERTRRISKDSVTLFHRMLPPTLPKP